jgi:4-aminobutyrate aminotransferase
VAGAFARGLLILGAGKNAIRFSPPLLLTAGQADIAIGIFEAALEDVERGATGSV